MKMNPKRCIEDVDWMNEWMKSYIGHVSSRRLFRALNIESNLARPVIIQIPTQSPGRYTAELQLRRIKLFFSPKKFALCAKYSHIVDFLGSRQMETEPTSIEVLLRPTLGQSDEPSDLRGSLSPTTQHRCTHVPVYTAPGNPRRSPIQLWTGPGVAYLHWSSRHRWANAVFRIIMDCGQHCHHCDLWKVKKLFLAYFYSCHSFYMSSCFVYSNGHF